MPSGNARWDRQLGHPILKEREGVRDTEREGEWEVNYPTSRSNLRPGPTTQSEIDFRNGATLMKTPFISFTLVVGFSTCPGEFFFLILYFGLAVFFVTIS